MLHRAGPQPLWRRVAGSKTGLAVSIVAGLVTLAFTPVAWHMTMGQKVGMVWGCFALLVPARCGHAMGTSSCLMYARAARPQQATAACCLHPGRLREHQQP